MVQLGLVRFFGQDIDFTCVRMAEINFRIYGFHGFWIKCALHLSGAELDAVPEPHQSAYREAQAAHANGDQQRVAEIARELRGQQMPLFDFGASEEPEPEGELTPDVLSILGIQTDRR